MMTGHKPYSQYKSSGIEWLGEIPSHWEILANKYIFKLKKDQVGKRSTEYDLLSLTLRGVIKRDMENPEGKFPAEFDTYQEVKKGDFVFCLFDVEETPRTVGLSQLNGMITGAYTVMEASANFDKNFLYYFYLNLDNKKRLKPLYKGLRNTIPKDRFLSFKTFVPTLPEQTAIADFLDRKTAQIDEFIALKEKTIALLQEQKTALINRAVTQGLNPDVPMKDSGIEWLGEIPAHWEVKKLKYVGKQGLTNGIFKKKDYFGAGTKLVNVLDVYQDNFVINYNDLERVQTEAQENKIYSVQIGDIFFVRSSLKLEGVAASACIMETPEETVFECHLVRFRPDEQHTSYKYLIYYLNSSQVRNRFISLATTTTMTTIPQPRLASLEIALPPLSEQRRIVAHIEQATAKIDQAIAQAQQQIALIKEYRESLMSQAVTGKIKIVDD